MRNDIFLWNFSCILYIILVFTLQTYAFMNLRNSYSLTWNSMCAIRGFVSLWLLYICFLLFLMFLTTLAYTLCSFFIPQNFLFWLLVMSLCFFIFLITLIRPFFHLIVGVVIMNIAMPYECLISSICCTIWLLLFWNLRIVAKVYRLPMIKLSILIAKLFSSIRLKNLTKPLIFPC